MSLDSKSPRGWAAGFTNLLDKELRAWWGTRRWLIHLVLWQVVVTGFIVMVTWESRGGRGAGSGLGEAMDVFFQAGGFFALIGAVLVTQGAIVGERRSGTAAWVLTKPVTRKAFVIAKFVAITATFLLLSLLLPAASVLVVAQVVLGKAPAFLHYLEAVGILALHQTFYIALTLMLGTIFRSRGPVAGVALGFWLAGTILLNQMPEWLVAVMPWPLARLAAAIAMWTPFPMMLWVPALGTAVLTVVALMVALWRFEREEF